MFSSTSNTELGLLVCIMIKGTCPTLTYVKLDFGGPYTFFKSLNHFHTAWSTNLSLSLSLPCTLPIYSSYRSLMTKHPAPPLPLSLNKDGV
jgi:hypothetical protein